MAEQRLRAWGSEIYEESAPENWRQIIRDTHVCAVVSPWHDLDVYDSDAKPDENGNVAHHAGDRKKKHKHIMWLFDGKKSMKQVLAMIAPLNGPKWVEEIMSQRVYGRYLCHLDEPQDVPYPKVVYPISEIELFNGASVDLSKPLAGEELKRVRGEVISWIREYNVTEYADVVDYAMDREPDWIEFVCNKTQFLSGYLRSKRGIAQAMAQAQKALGHDDGSEAGEV